MHVSTRAMRTAGLTVVLAIALLLTVVSSAFAASADATMGLSALQAKIDASGTVDGYLKTVVKGSDIIQIPVTISNITEGPYIVFEATGTLIQAYGGIAEGMSGSPIYVHDAADDQWKVVGALSLGDQETLGGTGLATPIESMLDIQASHPPVGVQTLSHPILTQSGVINRIMITSSTAPLRGATADGVAVVHPLATGAFLRGISSNSRLYKRFAARLAKHDISVIDLSGTTKSSPGGGAADFTTDFVPGAAIAALYSRGDLAYGGIGTVTYTDSSTVLAFGHPMSQSGDADLYMSNALIDGVWPSRWAPYKFGRVGKLRGTITQDRQFGIMGVVGQFTDETTITAEATNTASNTGTSSVVCVPASLLDSVNTGADGYVAEEIGAMGVYPAGSYLFDQDHVPGSAQTTTTVVVRDTDHNKLYTIAMPNFVSDDYDIPSAIVWDADDAVASLREELADDVYHYQIVSIDLKSLITPRQKSAQIVGVKVPDSLKTGANQVQVSLLAYGDEATHTVNVTLNIPAGVSTLGSVVAASSGNGLYQFPSGDTSSTVSSYRMTIPQIVNGLNASLPGNSLIVRFTPMSASDLSDDEDDSGLAALTTATSVIATAPTSWALGGTAISYPTFIQAHLADKVMDSFGFNLLEGYVDGADDPGIVSLHGTPAGSSTETTLGTTTVDPKDGSFEFPIEGLSVNTNLRVHVDSADGFSAGDTAVTAYVRVSAGFSASASSATTGKSVTLTARVYPPQNAGAKVTFEYYSKKAWHAIATKTLSGGSVPKATASYKVIKGATKVRYRFLGSAYNYATSSATKTVTGK